MADMTPAEIAAYRESIFSAMGLVNDGNGNYYQPAPSPSPAPAPAPAPLGALNQLAITPAPAPASVYAPPAAQPVAPPAIDYSNLFAGVQGSGLNPATLNIPSQQMTTANLGSGSFQTPSQGASTMADMTPAEVAAYRDQVLTAQGLANDGTGNYYDQSYYAAQPAAQAANNANTAATTASGLFGGVQNSVAQDAVRTAAGQAPGTFMPTPTPASGALSQIAGVQPVAAPTTGALTQIASGQQSGYTPEQIANIKGAWNEFKSGKRSAASIMSDMSQFNVNFNQIADATGEPVDQVIARLTGSQGSQGSYTQPVNQTNPNTIAPTMYGSAQNITQYPTYNNPQLPTYLPAATPYNYKSAQGPVASYMPPSYWANSQQAYGGMSAQKYADGGAVQYDPSRVDEIYNQLKDM